jgi:hypothetical protein
MINWIQTLSIIAANFGFVLTLFLWLRRESNADRRELSAQINHNVAQLTSSINSFKEIMSKESKDFHARLCIIEERNKQK